MRIENKWVLVTKKSDVKVLHYIENADVLTNDTLHQFDTFKEVCVYINDKYIDVSEVDSYEYVEILTEDELNDVDIQLVLSQMKGLDLE